MSREESASGEGLGPEAAREVELARVLNDYLAELEAGRPADPERFLARHPMLADPLRAYLELMHLAVRMVEVDTAGSRAGPISSNGLTVAAAPGRSVLSTRELGPGEPPPVRLRELPEEPGLVARPRWGAMPRDGVSMGRYELQGEIARGGMGAVLKGRDVDLGRDLAVKVLLESHRGSPEVTRRFIEEAQIGGQLQHPGIVPVYELGAFPEPDRRPYFAMKLIQGRTLAALLHERTDPAQDLPRFLAIFEQVCQTMAYAHARGVIHRDLKPSNIMAGRFGEVQVMDWGLAKVLPQGEGGDETTPDGADETVVATVRSGSAASASQAGSILGTPGYMAPEQARGELDRVDERADVFGLGAILCEVLTGHPPFVGPTREEAHARAERGELAETWDRLDACGAEAELIDLVRRCLAPARDQRPRDAGEVARSMTAYLAGVQERLRAAELARVEAQARAEEEGKRRRVAVALAASVLVTFGLAGGGWAYLAREQQRRAARVDLALREAEVLRDEARRAGDDLTRWIAARDAAQAVARLLADARDMPTRHRVAALVRQASEAARAAQDDQRLLARLVDIRSAEADDPDGSVSDAAYADAFCQAGIDVAALPPAEVGARIKARPASVAVALAAGLDDWTSRRRKARPEPEAGWRHLLAAARAADPDPRRDRLRELWSYTDLKAQLEPLRKLVLEADPGIWPVQDLNLLAAAVAAAGDPDAAVALLRRAWERYPGDVGLNYLLGFYLEHAHPPQTEEAIRFYSVARALRPETGHELAHLLERRGREAEAVAVFRDLVRLRSDDGRHWTCYGRLLKQRGDRAGAEEALNRAVAALRSSIYLKSENVQVIAWGHHLLGLALGEQGNLAQAITEYREAIRLKPSYWEAHSNLGVVLKGQGQLEEAIAECRTAIRLNPDDFLAYDNLGRALVDQGKWAEAIGECRKALRLKPDYPQAHNTLGIALYRQGRLAEAVAEYRQAIRLKPDFPAAHTNLGLALEGQGQLEEAIAECRMALRLNPEYAIGHFNLGVTLHDQGRLEEAITEYRAVLRLKPDFADAHDNLGAALSAQGNLEEAIAEYREALRLKPNDPAGHYNLGNALRDRGKREEAVGEYQEALRLHPHFPTAHCNLGLVLQREGRFAEALSELKCGHELGTKDPRWPYPSAQWVRQAQRLVELDQKLPSLLSGRAKPGDVAETCDLALVCSGKKLHGASARLWAEALRAQPKLAEDPKAGHRYHAACAATLAGSGQGKDDPPLDDATKTRWRKQAIDWLKADLRAWSQLRDTGPRQARPLIIKTLQSWKADPDLASLRDPAALAKLPREEQDACRALWTEVDTLLARFRTTEP